MKRLGVVYGGTLPEHRVLEDARFRRWIARTVCLPELAADDLAGLDGLIVPEGSHHGRVRAASPMIHAFLERGGTVVAFGDQPTSWLPGMAWQFRPALPSPQLLTGAPDYGFHQHVPVVDAIWHHHGVFFPPEGAGTILAAEDGPAVLYVDRRSTAGTMLISSLDPLRHCGETAMPAAGRFLELFFPWLVDELL